jgi:4-aminobutyrate aminotransferase
MEKEGGVGAVIAETVRNTGVIPPPDYWKRVRAARTGRMFSCEHYDVVPDILVVGKSLGGALFPLAGIIAREELDVAPHTALGHYTHEKNPVACTAALATIEFIEQENLLERSRTIGGWALERLREMQARRPQIGDVRGLGLLINVELAEDRQTRVPAIDLAERVMYEALSRSLSFKVTMGGVITLAPPLIITQQQMGRALEILEQSLVAAA